MTISEKELLEAGFSKSWDWSAASSRLTGIS